MIFTQLSVAALAAFTTAVSATSDFRFTKAVPNSGLLFGRDLDVAYQPETATCNEGETCAQACGAGYEECFSRDSYDKHCYNPSIGETCCLYPGLGTSCESGYFCAHDPTENTVCCGEGKTLDECAAINNLTTGALTSDPPVVPTTTTATVTLSTSTTSLPASIKTTARANSTSHHSSFSSPPKTRTSTSSSSSVSSTSSSTPSPTSVTDSGASAFSPAAGFGLIAAAVFAFLA